jgi:hypothetical protein
MKCPCCGEPAKIRDDSFFWVMIEVTPGNEVCHDDDFAEYECENKHIFYVGRQVEEDAEMARAYDRLEGK